MAFVTLINIFSVPPETDRKFIKSWHKTAEQMKQQPGFIDTKLHRILKQGGQQYPVFQSMVAEY